MTHHDLCFPAGATVLRPLREDDLPLTLEWRNRSDARIWFKNSAPIPPAAHTTWFRSYLTRKNDYMFVIEAGGRPIGQLGVYDISESDRIAEIGRIVVSPSAAGKGYMKTALCGLLGRANTIFGVEQLHLEVKVNNLRAIGLYRHVGFQLDSINEDLARMSVNVRHVGDPFTK